MACIYMLLDLEQPQDYMESTCFCTTQDQRRLPLMRRLLIYCICSKISYSSICPAIPIAYRQRRPLSSRYRISLPSSKRTPSAPRRLSAPGGRDAPPGPALVPAV